MSIRVDVVPPKPPLPPYFFLGYAHTPEQAWVARFYRDLCAEIIERTEWPTDRAPGFMDADGIRAGEDWRRAVGSALATCRVLVPLYSRRYFTRVECGREWHGFQARMTLHQQLQDGAVDVVPIVPALWTPVQLKYLPPTVRDLHIDFLSVNRTYAEEGLYTLIKNRTYKSAYQKVVKHLAERIIDAAEGQSLRVCAADDIDLSQNAFEQPPENLPPDRNLTIMVAAPTAQRCPPERDVQFYGPSALDWSPYRSVQPDPIAESAARIARSLDFQTQIVGLDEGLAGRDWSSTRSGLGLVLVDPWLALDPDSGEQLRRIDALGAGRIAVVAVWNSGSDAQTAARADEIRKALHDRAPRLLGDPDTPEALGALRTHSAAEFEASLPNALDRALNRYFNAAEASPPPGPSGARPLLQGPGPPASGPRGTDHRRQESEHGD